MSTSASARKDAHASPSSLSSDKKIVAMGKTFLNSLIASLKVAQIYDANNKVFMERVQALSDTLGEIFQNEGEAVVEITANHIFFNKRRIPMDFASYHTFHYLMDGLLNSGIGGIGFETNISKEELSRFVTIFAKSMGDPAKNLEDIEDEFEHHNVGRIHLYESPKRGEKLQGSSNLHRFGKHMYTKSIILLKQTVGNAPTPNKVQTKRVRRLVQTVIDAIIADETYMLALTNIKNHYDYTLNHCLNVCVLSTALGYRMGMERKRLSDLGMAALFHDFGKLFIPEEILTKPAKLTDEEFEVIKNHPFKGAEMLVQLKSYRKVPVRAILASLEHHRCVDHSGYPKVVFKKELNLFSRIIAIADVFDAVTTPRIYSRIPFKRDAALAMMMKDAGTKFDPLLLKAFINMVGVYPAGCLVQLNTGELAVVMETNQDPALLDRPKVKLVTDSSGGRIDGPLLDLARPDPGIPARTIRKSVDPLKYGIDVTEFL